MIWAGCCFQCVLLGWSGPEMGPPRLEGMRAAPKEQVHRSDDAARETLGGRRGG